MTLTKRSMLLKFALFFTGISVLTFGSSRVAGDDKTARDEVTAADRCAEDSDDGKTVPLIAADILFKSSSGSRILAVAFSLDEELVATIDEYASVSIHHSAEWPRIVATLSIEAGRKGVA